MQHNIHTRHEYVYFHYHPLAEEQIKYFLLARAVFPAPVENWDHLMIYKWFSGFLLTQLTSKLILFPCAYIFFKTARGIMYKQLLELTFLSVHTGCEREVLRFVLSLSSPIELGHH